LTRPGDTEATGSAEFVEGVKARLGLKARHRRIHKENSAVYALQEPLAAYSPDFEGKNEVLTYISHLAKLNSAIYPTQTK